MAIDNLPTTPADNNDTAFNAQGRHGQALKRVTSTDITHAVVRRDWLMYLTYDEYAYDYSSSSLQTQEQQVYSPQHSMLTDDYDHTRLIHQ